MNYLSSSLAFFLYSLSSSCYRYLFLFHANISWSLIRDYKIIFLLRSLWRTRNRRKTCKTTLKASNVGEGNWRWELSNGKDSKRFENDTREAQHVLLVSNCSFHFRRESKSSANLFPSEFRPAKSIHTRALIPNLFSPIHRANSVRLNLSQNNFSPAGEWGKCLWKLRWRGLLFKFSTSCLGIFCRVDGSKEKVGDVMFEVNEKNVSGKSRCYPMTPGTGWRLAFRVIINF